MTYRWHPTSEAPPILGMMFEDADAAYALFGAMSEALSGRDSQEQLSVTIIEGPFPENRQGYLVHLAPDSQRVMARVLAEGLPVDPAKWASCCRVQWMDQLPGAEPMLPRFKAEFAKHGKFLLAPVTTHFDGKQWVDVDLGVEKAKITFLRFGEVVEQMNGLGLS